MAKAMSSHLEPPEEWFHVQEELKNVMYELCDYEINYTA